MRVRPIIVVILVALAACSEPSATLKQEVAETYADLSYPVAYQATEGGFEGIYLFFDPASGESWSEYRDDREAVQKGGASERLKSCSQGTVGCYRTWGRSPLLSQLPPPEFLAGEYRYSARRVTYWSWQCTEISATNEQGTATSIICPQTGLVEFAIPVKGGPAPVDRFQLRSFEGLFGAR